MPDQLPQESRSQEIGERAAAGLYGSKPYGWRLHSLEGTDDAGLDYQVQLVVDQRYRHIFRLQLKGSESPSLNATGEFYSVTLKASTLKYYDQIVEPVLIVLCDLSADADPARCPCYFVWGHDEIRRLKAEGIFDTEADTKTVRIPKANVLNRGLDIGGVLETHLRLHTAASAFDQAVATAAPDYGPKERIQILGGVATEIPRRGRGFVDSLSTPGSSPWPQAPRESIAGRLNSVDQYLRRGDTTSAQRVLDELSGSISEAARMERAEFAYLTARVLSLDSRDSESVEHYQTAYSLEPSVAKYVVASVEAQLRERRAGEEQVEVSDLLALLTLDDPEVVGLAGRVLAAARRYEEADAKLRTLAPGKGLTEKAIVATMRGNTQAAISVCTEGLADPYVNDNARQLFHLLRARALFNEALHLSPSERGDYVVPVFGPSNVDIEKLNRAWADIERTAQLMRTAGWPTNVEFLSDIWGVGANILGRQEEILPDVLDAARKRPGLPGIQGCLERVAVQCGRPDLVLEAVGRQPEGVDRTFRSIAALHQAKEHGRCVDLLLAEKGRLPSDEHLYPICLVFGLLSAEQIARDDVVHDLEAELRSKAEWVGQAELAAYFKAIGRNALARDDALAKLEQAYEKHHSFEMAVQLFHALDVDDASQARKCIALAEVIRSRSQLNLDSTLHLAQAYVTTANWTSLLSLINGAIERCGTTGRLIAVKAFALDKAGYTAEAIDQLRELVKTGDRDRFAVNTYINIVARCGFTEEAIGVAEGLVSRETDKGRKLDYLRLLFGLVYRSNPQGQRAEAIAWRIGEVTKQTDESEEGLFLITYITATLAATVTVTEERRSEVQRRLKQFVERFPTSKILRMGTLPEKPVLEDLERMIAEVTGKGPEQRAHQQKLLNQLERGALPIPFAWRPKGILINVADVAALWEIAKVSRRDAAAYHLTMTLGDWKAVDPKILPRKIPILDVLTLLVVKDLKLFDTLFSIFPQVAVSQRTLMELQHLAEPMAGSFAREQCLQIIAELKKRFRQVLQPTAQLPTDRRSIRERDVLEEIKALVRSGKYFLYSDDVLFRIFAEAPDGLAGTMCTLDLLNAADNRGLLSITDIADRMARLFGWNVAVVITMRQLFACIPDSVLAARSVQDAVGVLQDDPRARQVFEGVWNVRKSYEDLVGAGAGILAELAKEPRNRVETIAAIWGVWYFKAKLRSDAEANPPIRPLALLMLKVATMLDLRDERPFRKLWQAFSAALPLVYGDKMEEKDERAAVEFVGSLAASLDAARPAGASAMSLKERMLKGLTEGTEHYSRFSDAFNKVQLQAALAKKKPK